MLSSLSCPGGPQPKWCPETTDDVLPSVTGLLPPGPAWEAASISGTVQNGYWRSFSSVLAFTYQRLCAYVDEFFCATVKESRDQWIAEYGLDDPCDPYGYNLCVKVAAQGGATCAYFVDIAAQAGWVITCHDLSKDPEPIAGCFECGCTPLGPTPVYAPYGTPMGYGEHGVCNYGEVVRHPDPDKWEYGKHDGAQCPVPGSNLGFGPDEGESCCFICGYYSFDQPVVDEVDYCRDTGATITFDCARHGIPADPTPGYLMRERGVFDSTGNYVEWGLANLWEVEVDIAASQAAVGLDIPAEDDAPSSSAGCFMAGGTPLCADTTASTPTFALCFLERIKPAHTKLLVKVLQP